MAGHSVVRFADFICLPRIPAANCWAIISRPLRGLYLFATHLSSDCVALIWRPLAVGITFGLNHRTLLDLSPGGAQRILRQIGSDAAGVTEIQWRAGSPAASSVAFSDGLQRPGRGWLHDRSPDLVAPAAGSGLRS